MNKEALNSRANGLSYDYHHDGFEKDEQAFLDRWLQSYIEIDNGRLPDPKRRAEKHIKDMLIGSAEIDTFGMEAYIKWKAAWATEATYKRSKMRGNIVSPQSEGPNFVLIDSDIGTYPEVIVASPKFSKATAKARGDTTREFLAQLKLRTNNLSMRVGDPVLWVTTALSTDFSRKFTEWTEAISENAPTVYDQAVDAVYNATHEGGSALHRLIDGQHGVLEMWEAVKNTSQSDTLLDEMEGYFSAFWKDLSTQQGLPFTSMSRESYDNIATELNQIFGIPKSWVADSFTVNATELLASSLGILALSLNWNSKDIEKFGEIAASLGTAAAFSANPVLALVGLVSLARAFDKGRGKKAYTEVLNGIAKGGIGSGVVIAVSSIVGGPTWIGLVVGLILGIWVRKYTDRIIDFGDLTDWIRQIANNALTVS